MIVSHSFTLSLMSLTVLRSTELRNVPIWICLVFFLEGFGFENIRFQNIQPSKDFRQDKVQSKNLVLHLPLIQQNGIQKVEFNKIPTALGRSHLQV